MSGFRALHAVLLLIAAAAIAVAAYLYLSQPKLGGTVPDAPTLARFESIAAKACHCARGKGEAGIRNCWVEFDKATQPYEPSSVASACMSNDESVCFGMNGGIVTPEVAKRIKCVSVNRTAFGACSGEEARKQAAAVSDDMGCGP